jgi:hypothetical protein
MSPQSTVTQIRLDDIVICLNAAVATIEVISKGLETPFLGPIVNTVHSLVISVQVILGESDLMLIDQHSPVNQKEQGRVCKDAGANPPVALCNHPSAHHV